MHSWRWRSLTGEVKHDRENPYCCRVGGRHHHVWLRPWHRGRVFFNRSGVDMKFSRRLGEQYPDAAYASPITTPEGRTVSMFYLHDSWLDRLIRRVRNWFKR